VEPNAPAPAPDAPATPRKALWGTLLALAAAWLGLLAGTAVGASFFVPAGSGLAGPAIALGYGVLGAALAAVVGAVVAWRGSPRLVRAAAAAGVVLGLLSAVALGWRVWSLEQEHRRGEEEVRPLAPTEPAPPVIEEERQESSGTGG
jgi:hypothetical protein